MKNLINEIGVYHFLRLYATTRTNLHPDVEYIVWSKIQFKIKIQMHRDIRGKIK